MMGFVDSSSSVLILNRVFDSIAEKPEGVKYMEFVIYLNTLLNGNQDDKIELCFKMIDSKKKGFLKLDDFKSLIAGAMIANTEHGDRQAIEYKARLTADVIYQKLGKASEELVTLPEFKETLQKDPSLLDIFTLLSKGVTESLVSSSEEETRLKWYLNQAKFIVVCVKAIIREIDQPTVLFGQKALATPTKGSQLPLHTASNMDETKVKHFASDFCKRDNKPPASDHRIVIRKKSPETKPEPSSAAKIMNQVIKTKEVEDKIEGLVKTDSSDRLIKKREESLLHKIEENEASGHDDGMHQQDELHLKYAFKPLLQSKVSPLQKSENNKEVNGSKPGSSFHVTTPAFNPSKPRDAQDFSFMNFASGQRFPSSRQMIQDDVFPQEIPEIPEESSILSVKKDQVADIIQERNKSFARLKEMLSNISNKAGLSSNGTRTVEEPLKNNIRAAKFGYSQGRLHNSDEEASPMVGKSQVVGPPAPPRSSVPRFKTLKTEVLNESMSYSNEGVLLTERGPVFLLRKKMEEILAFSEEMVAKLAQEMAVKEKEKQGFIEKKQLLKATTNIPSVEEPDDGPVVFVFHKRWDLVINIMIGINKATRALWDIEEHTLSKQDYKMRDKYELSFKRSITENLNSRETISFYSFAPYVFAEIRRLYKIDSETFLNSIGADSLINNLIRGEVKAYRELFSTGKSGSFFFYSVDGKYVIKTLRADEFSFLKSILMDYHKHLINYPNTLIPKFFGMHEIIYNKRGWRGCGCRPSEHLYLVIMDNIFVTDKTIQRRFDLKGSTYKRTVGFEKLSDTFSSKIALKDLDYLKMDVKIKIEKPTRDQVVEQLARDCEFLSRNSIIDYSLLIGIHSLNEEDEPMQVVAADENNSYFISIPSSDRRQIYYFGIIDVLTSFQSVKKKSEFCIKRVFLGPGISCVPPQPYSERFLAFMNTAVFV